jgi:dihydropteroate synthase
MSKTKLVGILNITPDSFSDGGQFNLPDAAAKQFQILMQEGADVIDIGAISTRPNNKIISYKQEIGRFKTILPSCANLINDSKLKISIDSFHYETLKFLADEIKFDWINDQSGFADERILNLAAETKKNYVLMHNLGLPANPEITMSNDYFLIERISDWFLTKIKKLEEAGINKEQIILDPGVGFGKIATQSLQIINEIDIFKIFKLPIMVAHSRKSFLNLFTDKPSSQRDQLTAEITAKLAKKSIDYVRVHNIKMNKEAIQLL